MSEENIEKYRVWIKELLVKYKKNMTEEEIEEMLEKGKETYRIALKVKGSEDEALFSMSSEIVNTIEQEL